MTKRLAFKRLALITLLLLGLASLLGAQAQAALKEKYPPMGQMVDVGGYRLHLYCEGEGVPTVIFDAGAGMGAGLAFAHLQPEVARTTRACVYDRAGQGWSEASPRPRTSQVIVEELHALLESAEVPAPYVLVGYSFGGLNTRLYAYRHPEEVAGLVQLDGSHEEQLAAFGGGPSPLVLGVLGSLPLLVRSRLPALVPSLIPLSDRGQLPAEARVAYQALLVSDPKAAEAGVGEMAVIEESFAQVRAARRAVPGDYPLGDIPLVVLMKGRADTIPGLTLSAEEQLRVWRELQADLAGQSRNSRLTVAVDSGHEILYEQPNLVLQAIGDVVALARQRPGPSQ